MSVLVKRSMRFLKLFNCDVWDFCLLSLLDRRKNKRYRRRKKKGKLKIIQRFYPYSGSLIKYSKFCNFFFDLFLKYKEFKRKKSRRFIYRVDLIEREERRKKQNERFASLRIIKHFFAILTYKQFRKLARIVRKKEGPVGNLFVLALEGRLINFLYRSLFTETIFESFFLIKQGYILVDKHIITYPNYNVNLYEILSVLPLIKRRFYLFLLTRIFIEKNIFFNTLNFIFISFRFLFSYMYKLPNEKDIPYRSGKDYNFGSRWPIDIYRAAGYAT